MRNKKIALPLKTKRLIVRAIELTDYGAWKQALSSQLPALNEFDSGNLTATNLTLQAFKKRLKQEMLNRKNDTVEVLHFFEKRTGKIIGRCGLEIQRGRLQSAHLGYAIFNLYWGQGFGYEAVEAVLDYIFCTLKIHRIEIGIESKNKRSIRLAKSLGFKREGVKRQFLLRNDEWRDVISYSLICDDRGIKWKR